MIRRGILALAVALVLATCLTACRPGTGGGPLVTEAVGGSGEVCVPLGDAERASIGWESVRNRSLDDVTVTDVSVRSSRAQVVDWLLSDKEWDDAGVRSRDLPDPGEARLPNTLGADKSALVNFTVEAKDLRAPLDTTVRLRYASADGPAKLDLTWRLRLVPRGQMCDTAEE